MLLTVSIAFITLIVYAQECTYYYPQIEGATLVYQHYDKSNKPSGKLSQELLSFASTSNGSRSEVVSKLYDTEDNLITETSLEMRCENGVFYFDMKGYVNQASMSAYEDMEIVVDATDVEFPRNFKVGDKLKDANIIITINTGFFPLKFSVNITDRVIEAKEDVTTPAGTFSAYKISQTTSTKFGIQIVSKTTEWYSQDVGMVKSKSWSSGGKLTSSSELISLTR